jgi:hypothetical protein
MRPDPAPTDLQAVPVTLALGDRHVGTVRRWVEGTLGWQAVEDDLDGPVPPAVRIVDIDGALRLIETGAADRLPTLLLVEVSAEHQLGPVTRTLRAQAFAQVEPVVGG